MIDGSAGSPTPNPRHRMHNIIWSFANKTVLVTGASRGIGLATANLFADAGAHVIALSRSPRPEKLHSEADYLTVDVTDSDAVAAACEHATSLSGHIDICIANAGLVLVEDYAATDMAVWRKQLEVNLLGLMRTWQAALPHMGRDGRPGRLIANSSAAAVRAEAAIPGYCASKAAVTALVQALGIKYAPRGITVNAVAPGEIDTELNRGARGQVAQAAGCTEGDLLADLLANHIPTGRLGESREIAALIAYLASSEASYLTGQTIVIDGGQLLI